MRHDLAYDKLEIAGDDGVKKVISTPANMKLIEESQAIIEKYKKGEIDPYTGAPISVRTVLTAWVMKFGFQKIEDVKSKIEKVKAIENSFINQGIRAFSRGYY